MDWTGVVEKNQERLKRILAMLVAMAGLTIGESPPLRGRCPAGQRGVGSGSAATLPRYRHRAILRLLRPAESAVRRLIVVAARDVVVELPPLRLRKPGPASIPLPKGAVIVRVNLGLAGRTIAPPPRPARRSRSLPMADPRKRFGPRRKYVPPHAVPRILSLDRVPHRLPPPPSRDDPIDATRLTLRLAALASALADLPAHARRFARWKASRDAGGTQDRDRAAGMQDNACNDSSRRRGAVRRISPLRPGRPPGQTSAKGGRRRHEVHEVLADLQYFAREALERPDTS